MIFDTPIFNERLFFPRRDVSGPPRGAVDRMIDVESSVALHLRIHPGAGHCTVLFFHGNGEVVADYDDAAPLFAQAGARLAVVDFRGYGTSTGAPTLRAAIGDAPKVLQAVANDAELANTPLVVMGRSLGAVCAIELYGRRPKEVAGFVIESGASNLEALIRRRGLRVPELDEATRATFDPIPKLRRGAHPLLVMHGSHDDLIDPGEAEQAFAVAGTKAEDKSLALIAGRGHNDVSLAPDYWSSLKTFLGKLRASASSRGDAP
jgi:alpha-beta hydrolase superfamily lysophospholipase